MGLKLIIPMKKVSLLLLVGCLFWSACEKNEDKPSNNHTCTTCVNNPEANPALNNSSGGVYKGIIVGSSGTIALYLHNDSSNEVKALVVFDGGSATLTTTDLNNWTPGQAITNALFTGTVNNTNIQAVFSVDANGQNPSLAVNIPGHTVVVALYKETSTTLVKSFEGTYAGDNSGTFNLLFHGDHFNIIVEGGQEIFNSSLTNGEMNFSQNDVEIKGQFNGADQMNGTWKDTENGTQGTWTANRTL